MFITLGCFGISTPSFIELFFYIFFRFTFYTHQYFASVYHVHAYCPQGQKMGVKSPRTGITDSCSLLWGCQEQNTESEQLLLNTGPSFQYPGQFCLFYLNYKLFIFTNHLQVNYYLVNVNMSLLCQTFLNFSIHKFTTYFPFDLSWSLIIIFSFLDNYRILKQLFCIKLCFYSVVLDKNIRFFGLQIMNWQDFIFASL